MGSSEEHLPTNWSLLFILRKRFFYQENPAEHDIPERHGSALVTWLELTPPSAWAEWTSASPIVSGPTWSIFHLTSILTQYQSCDIGGPPPFTLDHSRPAPAGSQGSNRPSRRVLSFCWAWKAGEIILCPYGGWVEVITHRGVELRGRK